MEFVLFIPVVLVFAVVHISVSIVYDAIEKQFLMNNRSSDDKAL